mgnify:FL=1|tara:strand:+ start:762 stop:1106 length:345 start_codon:yes stop_codon:yes gene_type:complete
MKKFFKKTTYILIVLVFFSGCQATQDVLSNTKKNNSDVFLIEKKNPLVLPPDFDNLPIPQDISAQRESEIDETNNISLKEILKKNTKTNNSKKQIFENNKGILEKSIIKEIKNN